MSRISRKNTLNQQSLKPKADEPSESMELEECTEQLNFAENKTSDEHIARVVFEANATAEQLSRGHVVRLAGAKKIFETGMEKMLITPRVLLPELRPVPSIPIALNLLRFL